MRRSWPMPTSSTPDAIEATVYLNGKFRAQRTTGVQRVAAELVRALDQQRPPGRWTLLLPAQAARLPLTHIDQRHVGPDRCPLHVWEQCVLPLAARDGLLLSLAGGAPWLGSRQFAVLHDAAVFDHPQAYTRAFVAWYRRLFRHLARDARALATVSDFSRQRLSHHLRIPGDRLAVLSPGADHLVGVSPDPRTLPRLGLTARPFLLAVGSDNPTKNLPRLVRAWQAIGDRRPDLVIVGASFPGVFAYGDRGPDPAGLVRTGSIEDAELIALYRGALALVCPSVYEGFGLPPVEAMSMGCPVVAARAASLPEVCGDAALYFDPYDDDDLADALRRVTADVALRQRLSDAGRAQAANYRWADTARGLQRWLSGLGILN